MTLSGKDYINDLIPNSGAIQAINDDFRHIVQNLHLWSFYESVKTNLGVSQALIVEKDSAILGIDFFPNFILKPFLFVRFFSYVLEVSLRLTVRLQVSPRNESSY